VEGHRHNQRSANELEDARVALGLAADSLRISARELAAAGLKVPESKLFSEEAADVLSRVKALRDSILAVER
jgi:hypothetical protein